MLHAPRRRSLPRLVTLATVLLAVMATLAPALCAPASARAVPSERTWKKDVRTVMADSRAYLAERAAAAAPGEQLAINLDIDNTSLATYYDRGQPVKPTLKLAQAAHDLGYAVFFNTGRLETSLRGVGTTLVKRGYTVDALCTRMPGETLPVGKQRCRASFVAQGYTIVANVGNNPTDFAGGDYERAYRLPNYRGLLG